MLFIALDNNDVVYQNSGVDWIVAYTCTSRPCPPPTPAHPHPGRRSATPDTTHPWGIGVFDVDPGRFPGDKTSIRFTFYHRPAATTANPSRLPSGSTPSPPTRTRSDGFGFRERGRTA